MKASLRPGVSRTNRIVVDPDRTISFMGEVGRVYATPWFVRDVEHTCRDLILEHTDPGEDSVGIEVALKHSSDPSRHDGRDHGDVTAVEGRKVAFEVAAKDEIEPIGGGMHARFVVDVAKTLERVKAKGAKHRAR